MVTPIADAPRPNGQAAAQPASSTTDANWLSSLDRQASPQSTIRPKLKRSRDATPAAEPAPKKIKEANRLANEHREIDAVRAQIATQRLAAQAWPTARTTRSHRAKQKEEFLHRLGTRGDEKIAAIPNGKVRKDVQRHIARQAPLNPFAETGKSTFSLPHIPTEISQHIAFWTYCGRCDDLKDQLLHLKENRKSIQAIHNNPVHGIFESRLRQTDRRDVRRNELDNTVRKLFNFEFKSDAQIVGEFEFLASHLPPGEESRAHALLRGIAEHIPGCRVQGNVYEILARNLPKKPKAAAAAHADLRARVDSMGDEETRDRLLPELAKYLPPDPHDAMAAHNDLCERLNKNQNSPSISSGVAYFFGLEALARHAPAGHAADIHGRMREYASEIHYEYQRGLAYEHLAQVLPPEPEAAAEAHADLRHKTDHITDETSRQVALSGLLRNLPPGKEALPALYDLLRRARGLTDPEIRRTMMAEFAKNLPKSAFAAVHRELREWAYEEPNEFARADMFATLMALPPPGHEGITAYSELLGHLPDITNETARTEALTKLARYFPPSINKSELTNKLNDAIGVFRLSTTKAEVKYTIQKEIDRFDTKNQMIKRQKHYAKMRIFEGNSKNLMIPTYDHVTYMLPI